MPEAFIQEYVSQGDKLFQGMHLHAWRRAEEAYARAFSLAPRQEIRDKLSLTRLLRMTREIDALHLRMQMKLVGYRDSSVELLQAMIGPCLTSNDSEYTPPFPEDPPA